MDTMKEYLDARNRIGKKAIDLLDNQWFTARDFIRMFFRIEYEEKTSVETPYTGKFNYHHRPEGGHRFLDWHERTYRYLRTQVKKGVLVTEKRGRLLFWKKA